MTKKKETPESEFRTLVTAYQMMSFLVIQNTFDPKSPVAPERKNYPGVSKKDWDHIMDRVVKQTFFMEYDTKSIYSRAYKTLIERSSGATEDTGL